MKSFRPTLIIAFLFFSFTITTNCQAKDTPLEGLDARVEAMMADWNVPNPGDIGDTPPNLIRFVLGADGKPADVYLNIEGEVPLKRRTEEG